MAKTREHQELLYACTQEGCAICRLVHESTYRYLDAWKYELFTDVEIREELRRTQGFCHSHTWQLARMGATLPLAQAYRDILSDTMEQLQRANGEPVSSSSSGSGKLLRRLFETRRERSGGSECPACIQREKAEERFIHTLRQALLDEEFYQQFAASEGLCLGHLRLASELKTADVAGAWLPRLRRAQIICLQRLDEQLGELIRKHDYHFRHEPRGQEMLSWRRAAGLVAGEDERT